jgi:hypothetical protein
MHYSVILSGEAVAAEHRRDGSHPDATCVGIYPFTYSLLTTLTECCLLRSTVQFLCQPVWLFAASIGTRNL